MSKIIFPSFREINISKFATDPKIQFDTKHLCQHSQTYNVCSDIKKSLNISDNSLMHLKRW